MIYLAPLQGFTDFVYRKLYAQLFTNVDTFFVPYISMKNDGVPAKYTKEVLPVNNPQERVVPQILVKDGNEALNLLQVLKTYAYNEINLNLGCPYPMVTKRGKGSGLLPYPEKVNQILQACFQIQGIELSVKLRAGLEAKEELEALIPVLNNYPLKEVILHPRIAKQLYSGNVYDEAFLFASNNLKHKLVFNGDIFSMAAYENRKKQFPNIEDWMLGRGVLMNPFLPAEINGIFLNEEQKHDKLLEFHKLVLDSYLDLMDNEGNALNKMQQFWIYFSYNFPNQKKAFKAIKKAKNMRKYLSEVQALFAQL